MSLQLPSPEDLTLRVPCEHPRILLTTSDLATLQGQLDAPSAQLIATLQAQCAIDLEEPLPEIELAADLYVPGGDIWEVRYLQEGPAGFARAGAMGRPFGAICSQVPRQALIYRLTGDRRHRDRAAEGLVALAAMPLPATGYANTHTFHGAVSTLAMGLDYLWDDLDEQQRDPLVAALVARANEFHELSVRVALRNPLDSHAIMYGMPGMTNAALALYHHREEAVGWLADVLAYFAGPFPGYGGDDGGWGQGFGYGDGVHQATIHTLWRGTGVDVFDTPWGRNSGRFMLYFQPPYGSCPNFGDAGYGRPKGLQKQVMGFYARIHQDPYFAWFSKQLNEVWERDEILRLSMDLSRKPMPEAKAPRDLPQARHQRDIGWVVFHSALAEAERNVMLQFKSSRFGSFSHSHADQNSFVLEAYGRPLLIDSGYYPWYGSPHDIAWTRQTRAHNALLINGRGQGVCNGAAKGRIIAFAHSADFDYVAGDSTAAYQQPSLTTDTTSYHLRKDFVTPVELCACYEGVQRMVRHILFLRPDTFVILDEVRTEQAASVQFQMHALNAFTIDPETGTAEVVNGAARARIHFLTNAVNLSQTGQFPVPPEHDLPDQWHLTADWEKTEPSRRLLTVIQVGRVGDEFPAVEELLIDGQSGARVGSSRTLFDLDSASPRVQCSGVRADGSPVSFEHSVGRGQSDQ